MEASRERDDELPGEGAGDHCTRMPRNGGVRKAWNLGVRYACDCVDLVRESAKPGAEHDGGGGCPGPDFRVQHLRRGARRTRTKLTHTAPRSPSISCCAAVSSVSRSAQGRNALSNELSAIAHNSSKSNPIFVAASTYSSVSVVPLIKRLSVLSTTFMPASK